MIVCPQKSLLPLECFFLNFIIYYERVNASFLNCSFCFNQGARLAFLIRTRRYHLSASYDDGSNANVSSGSSTLGLVIFPEVK